MLQQSPTTQSSPNPASSTPEPEQDSQTPPNPLNSPLLYIHPPLAITGYVFVFLFAILVFKNNYFERRITKMVGIFGLALHILRLVDGNAMGATGFGKLLVMGPQRNNDAYFVPYRFRGATFVL